MAKTTTASKKRTRPTPDPFSRYARAVRDYLATVGWAVVVVGHPKIEQAADDTGTFNYTFSVRMTAVHKTPGGPTAIQVPAMASQGDQE